MKFLHQYPTTNRKASVEHITRSPSQKFNQEQRTISTRRSNGRPEGRPIFIAKTSNKCTRCGKWQIQDSLNSSSSNLVCKKHEQKVWLQQKWDECGRSGAGNVHLISGMHVLCTVWASVRCQLEVESLQEIRSSSERNATHKIRVRR